MVVGYPPTSGHIVYMWWMHAFYLHQPFTSASPKSEARWHEAGIGFDGSASKTCVALTLIDLAQETTLRTGVLIPSPEGREPAQTLHVKYRAENKEEYFCNRCWCLIKLTCGFHNYWMSVRKWEGRCISRSIILIGGGGKSLKWIVNEDRVVQKVIIRVTAWLLPSLIPLNNWFVVIYSICNQNQTMLDREYYKQRKLLRTGNKTHWFLLSLIKLDKHFTQGCRLKYKSI